MFPASNASVSKDCWLQNYSVEIKAFMDSEKRSRPNSCSRSCNSEPIRTRIIEKYNLMEHYEIDPEEKYPLTQLYEMYKSNIKFSLTEYMSVEISVMDSDPEISAAIANDISDLVDTVFNSMKKKRARDGSCTGGRTVHRVRGKAGNPPGFIVPGQL